MVKQLSILDMKHYMALMSRCFVIKITNMLANFDCEGKDIEIIYCHSFQPRLFSDNNWDFAETVRYYTRGVSKKYLLKRMMLLKERVLLSPTIPIGSKIYEK